MCQLFTVASVDSDVAEGGSAIVLHINIGGGEELDEDRDGAGVDELLTIVI